MKIKRICQHCNKPFGIIPSEFKKVGRGKYCSNKCQNLARRKRVDLICKNCGIKFERVLSKKNNKYCSIKCRNVKENPNMKPIGSMIIRRYMKNRGVEYISIKMAHPKTWKLEHRVIVEKVLGRKLKRNELVHHIDGNGLNNSHENLLICDYHYHTSLHNRMSKLYAQEKFGAGGGI